VRTVHFILSKNFQSPCQLVFNMQLSAFTFLSVVATVLAAPAGETQTLIRPTSDTTKCLVATSNADGAAVQITRCVPFGGVGAANQAWTVTGGTLRIFGDKCLDDTNGVTTNGEKMQIFTCFAGNTNQKWAPTSAGSISLAGTNKCLDNTDGVFTNGNPVSFPPISISIIPNDFTLFPDPDL
jgi:hypothetical protein